MTTQISKSRLLQPEMMIRRSGVWELVGNTPLTRITHLAPHISDSVHMYAKLEWTNPGGSIKDRPAAAIIKEALRQGRLGSGQILLDSTSGNMGIAYATFCASLSIPVHLVLPANASPERLAILRALGAELTLSDPLEGTDGAQALVSEMAAADPGRYFHANQYNNPANWQAHFTSTGPEILKQTHGKLTHFIAGLGTTGTMMGVGRYLRQAAPTTQLIAVQPATPLHGLEGLKHLPTSIQPGIYDPSLIDRTLEVTTEDSYTQLKLLARQGGWLAGLSSGAALAAAIRVAEELTEGVLVVIFPDSAAKYLSQPIWSTP